MDMLLRIDTSLLDKFSGIITLVVAGGMIIVVGRFLISKSISGAASCLIICGLLLWAVNDLESFMTFINNIITFTGNLFSS